ncbi:inhibitor of NF-kappa-B activation [Equine molluscum contagiosum-like virus]|nr:inhibitor of NF-kappa-B activation [Equine molluscum contagiosum-like virus]
METRRIHEAPCTMHAPTREQVFDACRCRCVCCERNLLALLCAHESLAREPSLSSEERQLLLSEFTACFVFTAEKCCCDAATS